MKQKFTKFGLLAAMLLAFLPASAYDFKVDGFYYEIVDFSELTCAIVSGDNKYEGDVVIPTEVEFNNRKLKVTEIGICAFEYCRSLTSVSIPDSVTEIGNGAFEGCSSLTSVSIPDSVTYIGWGAFEGCSSLTSVTIPNSVTYIDDDTFSGCSSLTSVTIPNSVTEIWPEAFRGCSSLTSVTIPNSVTIIGSSTFSECSSLTSVTIPDSVTGIGSSTFSGCSSLKSITLSDNLTSIKYGTFEGCESLTSITIPGSVETICQSLHNDYGYTFGGCNNLKSISFMYSETELVPGNLDGFVYLEFCSGDWESWTGILENVFIDRELEKDLPVPNLKELTIGEHVTELQIKDINKCDKLESIVSYAMNPPSVSSGFSKDHYMNLIVKVPNEALEAYKSASVWKNFWNLQGFDASGVDDIEIDDAEKTVVGRYDLNGRPVNDDYKGMTIIRFSDGSTKKVVMQ